MHKIADGYFYDVYDIGNGRVLKKKKSFLNIAQDIKKENPGKNRISVWLKTREHIRKCVHDTKIIQERLSSELGMILGNPVFKGRVNYAQDKVITLIDYFDTHSLEENKKIIDKYMVVLLELLKFGIHDRVYKFKNSYGVNTRGEVIFIDFNEVTFSKEKVLEFIESKKWARSRQFQKLPDDLREYFGLKYSETLTPTILNAVWQTRLGTFK